MNKKQVFFTMMGCALALNGLNAQSQVSIA